MSEFLVAACPLFQDPNVRTLGKLVEGKIKIDIDVPINAEIIALHPVGQIPALLVKCPVTEDQTKCKRRFVFKPLLHKFEENEEQVLKYIGTFPILKPKIIQTDLQMDPNQPQRQEFEEVIINVFEEISKE